MITVSLLDPKGDPARLWTMQSTLLSEVEGLLGPRDSTKMICQPTFGDDGPIVVNTPNLDGCFARLSRNAERYWPTAMFELAHETIHLLNPVVGLANNLEEGVAVHFSLVVWERYAPGCTLDLPRNYAQALAMVRELDPSVYPTAKLLRKHAGSLRSANAALITLVVPSARPGLAEQLVCECGRRP